MSRVLKSLAIATLTTTSASAQTERLASEGWRQGYCWETYLLDQQEVLLELLSGTAAGTASTASNRQWYDTDPAYKFLDLDQAEQLREAVRSGLLRIGHEVRDRHNPQARLPRHQFHIGKCQKHLSERPERRWQS